MGLNLPEYLCTTTSTLAENKSQHSLDNILFKIHLQNILHNHHRLNLNLDVYPKTH